MLDFALQTSVTMISGEEDEGFLKAMGVTSGIPLMMVLKACIELGVFETIAKAGEEAKLSAKEIAASLPTQNHNAPNMIDRMLKFLASHSILSCTITEDKNGGAAHQYCLYGLAPVCKHFVSNEDGVSLSPMVQLMTDRAFMDSWYALKDAVVEGGIPFNMAHNGMHLYEYPSQDSRFNEVFNKAMQNHSTFVINKVVECYKGFEGANVVVVDVGGGFGATLANIVSKHPNIRGINFDLPHVIKQAPLYPGVEHIAGDMFESVPSGDVIFMKWILHNWDDEHCLKLLKNCWKALPECGKVVLVEGILPQHPGIHTTLGNGNLYLGDIMMMTMNPGGKERAQSEFEALAKEAGFAALKLICPVYTEWVIELYKLSANI